MFIENKRSGFLTLLEYAIYGFFALFPFFIFKNFLYQGSSSRFLLLSLVTSILSIGLGIYLFNPKNKISFLKSPILIVFSLYFIYIFISAILGADFSASFWSRAERTSGLFYFTNIAIFTLFLINIVSEKLSREKLLKVVLFTSATYSFLSFLGHQGLDIIFRTNPYDGFLFGNSSFAAMYLLGAFLLSFYYLFIKSGEGIKWYEYLLPILIVVNPFFINMKGYSGLSSILGAAKASSVALFVSIGILFVIFLISKLQNIKTKKVIGLLFFSLSIFGVVFLMSSLLTPGTFVRNFYEGQSTLARPLAWEITKNAISQKPITGWGGDNFSVAFQENFDMNLLTEKYGNEPWFDRAHNIVLDQTLESGYIGTALYFALYITLFICLLYVLFKTKSKEDGVLASVLITYFFVHLIELQTAFDTTISYVMFSLMVALSVYVFNKVRVEYDKNDSLNVKNTAKYILGGVLLVYFSWSLFAGVFSFWGVQIVNGKIRTVGSAEKRIPLYEKLFDTKVDPAGILWRTSTDFQRGISENPKILENQEKVKFLIEELGVITKGYEDYVKENPEVFRPYLNLADLYIYHMLFGINRLDEADSVLDNAIKISDKYPQPYWMKAVISLYRRDFANARKYVEIAKQMNPDVVETKRLEKYIEESIKTFPEIELYYFNQI